MIKLVAEIGSNHNGSLDRCMRLIEKARELNFWGVKFQLFKAEKLTFDKEKQKEYKKQEMPDHWILKIREKCDKLNIKFGCTPFYPEAIPKLRCVDFLKISSFDILRLDLIEKCIETQKPVCISCGLATDEDIKKVIDIIISKGNMTSEYYLLHCVSKYPTRADQANLSRIRTIFSGVCRIRDKFVFPGYSDHTKDIDVIIEALNQYSQMIEMHFDLADGEGSESKFGHCWLPSDMRDLDNRILKLNSMLGNTHISYLTEKHLSLRADPKTGLRK